MVFIIWEDCSISYWVFYTILVWIQHLWNSKLKVLSLLQEGNVLTRELLRRVNQTGRIYVSPGEIRGKFIIRFVVTSWFTTEDDIQQAWDVISKTASTLLAERPAVNHADELESLRD